jgi:hypothetical protein
MYQGWWISGGRCVWHMLAVVWILVLAGGERACAQSNPSGEVIYQFNSIFSGPEPNGSGNPWVTAKFETVSAGMVRLTVWNTSLTGQQNLDQIDFNLNPLLDASQLRFAWFGGSGGFDLPTVRSATDSFRAAGGSLFDIELDFARSGNPTRLFNYGEFVSYQISGIPSLAATDFLAQSAGQSAPGPFLALAHVQRIGISSAWIYSEPGLVPEPSIAALACTATFLLVLRRRLRARC